jgi:hypothetical protein
MWFPLAVAGKASRVSPIIVMIAATSVCQAQQQNPQPSAAIAAPAQAPAVGLRSQTKPTTTAPVIVVRKAPGVVLPGGSNAATQGSAKAATGPAAATAPAKATAPPTAR